MFRQIFGNDFKNHVAFVLTRWETGKYAEKQRKFEGGLTEFQRKDEIN